MPCLGIIKSCAVTEMGATRKSSNKNFFIGVFVLGFNNNGITGTKIGRKNEKSKK